VNDVLFERALIQHTMWDGDSDKRSLFDAVQQLLEVLFEEYKRLRAAM
jgi:hypothetical protein